MTPSVLKVLIESFVDTTINEILGKFNFQAFKQISANNKRPQTKGGEEDFAWEHQQHPEIVYAKKFLPELGQGSSRVTFALSGGKVLKIALNKQGFQQNKQEVEVFTGAKDNDLVTKIYDLDPQFKWLVSEIVKEIPEKQFKDYTGIDAGDLYLFGRGGTSIEDLRHQREQLVTDLADSYTDTRYAARLKYKLEAIDRLFSSPQGVRFMDGLYKMIATHSLAAADILPHHFGRTVDGHVRLFDYGFSKQMYNFGYQ